MAFRVDRYRVEISRQARAKMKVQDTLSFVEDGDFLAEFRECGLGEDELEDLQIVITVFPDCGDVVPVSTNIRDALWAPGSGDNVVIRYVHLKPTSTVLLLTAYPGDASLPMTAQEARKAEQYVTHQTNYFLTRFTQ
jgi:hypothetical protein